MLIEDPREVEKQVLQQYEPIATDIRSLIERRMINGRLDALTLAVSRPRSRRAGSATFHPANTSPHEMPLLHQPRAFL